MLHNTVFHNWYWCSVLPHFSFLPDVFWYRESATISQLEDDHKYEILSRDGKFSIEIFNLTKEDAGSYLCIGVNELGRCSHNFKVAIKGMFGHYMHVQ